jgi:hypothetical protein
MFVLVLLICWVGLIEVVLLLNKSRPPWSIFGMAAAHRLSCYRGCSGAYEPCSDRMLNDARADHL